MNELEQADLYGLLAYMQNPRKPVNVTQRNTLLHEAISRFYAVEKSLGGGYVLSASDLPQLFRACEISLSPETLSTLPLGKPIVSDGPITLNPYRGLSSANPGDCSGMKGPNANFPAL